MREMDLQVQNSVDSVEKRVKVFFANARKMKPAEKENEFQSIRSDYQKALEDADEKVHLANQMHDQLDRYVRRLDQELLKFKVELEADNHGITEILEKRSLELDEPQNNSSQKENRFNHGIYRPHREKKYKSSHSMIKKKRLEKISEMRPQVNGSSGGISDMRAVATGSQSVGYNLGHIGVGGNAIAAAASQAIAATQQMQQGRRTASLKASYEAINIGVNAHDFSIGRELAGAAQTAIAAISDTRKKQKRQKTKTKRSKLWEKYGMDGGPGEGLNVSTSISGASSTQTSIQVEVRNNEVSIPDMPRKSASATMSCAALPSVMSPLSSFPIDATSMLTPIVTSNCSPFNSHNIIAGAIPIAASSMELLEPSPPGPPDDTAVDQVTDLNDPDWTYDPNEPRYCLCNEVSYGDMVACDNEDCPLEWFHYPCVGITTSPKGKWYCPQCTSHMKKRGSRK